MNEFRPEFCLLKKRLEEVSRRLNSGTADTLELLVQFFGIIAPVSDRGVEELIQSFRETEDHLPEDLLVLSLHLKNAGRNRYGWNRTEPGERVGPDKVYLGNIFGLFTKPVSYWLSVKNDPDRDGWKGTVWEKYCENMNSYDVVARQAKKFMLDHLQPMIQALTRLTSSDDELRAA